MKVVSKTNNNNDSSWQAFVRSAYGDDKGQVFEVLNKNDETIGSFGWYAKSKYGQKMLITPPFLTNIGLSFKNPASKGVKHLSNEKELLLAIADQIKSESAKEIDLVLPYSFKDAQVFQQSGFEVGLKYTYLLDLTQTENELLANLTSNRRKNIKQIEKEQLTFKSFDDKKQICQWANETLTKGGAKYDIQVIETIVEYAIEEGIAICTTTSKNDTVLAMHFSIILEGVATYLFSYKKGELAIAGTCGLWNNIMTSKQHEAHTFDFAGSSVPRIEKFFREFGGELTPMINIKKSSRLAKLAKVIKK